MQSNEKTNDKANLQANQQPKKTWQEPELIVLDINGGGYIQDPEKLTGTVPNSAFYNP